MSSPRRDKFAALAQQQQDKQQNQPSSTSDDTTTTAAATTTAATTTATTTAATTTAATTTATATAPQTASTATPKRDKLAATSAHQRDAPPPPAPPPPPVPAPPPPPPPRRDKFSAMASRSGNKSSARDGTNQINAAIATAIPNTDASASSTDKHHAQQEQRRHQRDAVWKDLAQAQAITVKLLATASQTVAHLSAACNNPNTAPKERASPHKAVQECMATYQQQLQTIHGLLADKAPHIQPYQTTVNTLSSMYQARVELALAEEKRCLVAEFLRLEQAPDPATSDTTGDSSVGGAAGDAQKRKRED